jgi:NitT/TauT family transport system substrate-binding protein
MKSTKARLALPALFAALGLLLASLLALLPAGCGNSAADDSKVKIAYLGLTCEAPLFVAEEQGFYKEEGLDAELVRTDWDGLREGLNTGQFDANHTLIMYLLMPIAKGNLDAKITGGIHTGCLRLQVGVKTDIKVVEDLKGKTIGVPTHLGSPPHLFASRVLAAHGIDPGQKSADVTWLVFPPDVLGKKLEDGTVDAVATSDPIGTILLGKGLVKTLVDQAEDKPYRDEYCCAAVVSGKLARERPAIAAKVTRAMLKGAKWVEANPAEAAKVSVEKKYISASVEINTRALSTLRYIPGVDRCRTSIGSAAKEMKQAGLLDESTDPEKLTERAWLKLDGVNDDWLKDVKVTKSQRPRVLSPAEFAALYDGRLPCCNCCCISE